MVGDKSDLFQFTVSCVLFVIKPFDVNSFMNTEPTWWTVCGSVGLSFWRTGRPWSACCWMSPCQERRVRNHSFRLAQLFTHSGRNLLWKGVILYFSLIIISFGRKSLMSVSLCDFSSDWQAGDGPGGDHALCHSAGLWMPPSYRQGHREEGKNLLSCLTSQSIDQLSSLNDFIFLKWLVIVFACKRSWLQKRRKLSWMIGRGPQRCSLLLYRCYWLRWLLCFWTKANLQLTCVFEGLIFPTLSFLVIVLCWYW